MSNDLSQNDQAQLSSNTSEFVIRPIGRARTCFPDKFGTPRQPGLVPTSEAFLEIDPLYQPAISLQGLETFTHVWVLFHFHRNTNARYHAKVHPPRLNGQAMGVFATRSPHRPNPIGLSLCPVLKIEDRGIWVGGLDVMDQTPILDLKPYLPFAECLPHAKAGWVEDVDPLGVTVIWQPSAESELSQLTKPEDLTKHKSIVEETLRQDPRPIVYKNTDGSESKYRDQHEMRILNLDVHFQFLNAKTVSVIKVLSI